ncbi:MAG TPA: hypothetical protein DF383_08550, partial [Deltaproteobacteria bacterium]|nr:hypothetical protein [Deltaproteobacteria bacterium]
QYLYTWDIIKWFLTFEISGRLLILWTYIPLLSRHRILPVLACALILFGTATPLRYLWDFAMKDFKSYSAGEKRYTANLQPKISPEWEKLLARMRDCEECFGTVWTPYSTAPLISSQTGYFSLPLEHISRNFGIAERLQEKRKKDLERLETAPNSGLLKELGIKWIIFSCRDFEALPEAGKNLILELQSHLGARDFSSKESKGDCYRA